MATQKSKVVTTSQKPRRDPLTNRRFPDETQEEFEARMKAHGMVLTAFGTYNFPGAWTWGQRKTGQLM